MLAKLSSYTLVGIDAAPVEVEVDVSPASMPKTVLVGLAETAVRESTHRVERALVNSGYHRPMRPGRDQPGPGRPQEGCRGVRSADRAGAADRQRAGRAGAAGAICRRRRAGSDGRDAADQGRPRHGPRGGGRGARRTARPHGERRRGGRRRGDRRLPDRQPGPGRRVPLRAARPRAQRDRPRRGLPQARPLPRTTSSTSRGRTTPSAPW